MRKTRIIAILCLSLILCFLCVTTNTFSWFTRPKEGNGNSFSWSKNSYNQTSSKNFDVRTYEMTSEEGVYGTESISKISKKTIPAGKRVCYKTEIKNLDEQIDQTSKIFQTVSLYLSGVDSTGYANTYVGVNNPMKTYKHLQSNTGNKVINDINKKNVYVGFNIHNDFNPADFSVHYWGDGVTPGNSVVASDYQHGTIDAFNSKYDLYHAEIPYDATCVKPRLKDSENYYGTDNTNVDTKNLIGIFKGGFGTNADYASTGKGAGIKQFYSLATVSVGKTIDLSAIAQGTSINYKVEDSKIATVDSNGVVTGKSVGQTKLTLTATGAHGDTQTANCRLVVTAETKKLISVPVVTNVKIYPYNKTSKENLVTVYWYIKNEGSSDITVSVDKINLTL